VTHFVTTSRSFLSTTWLIVTMLPVSSAPDDFGSLDDILVSEITPEIVSGTLTPRTTGSAGG